MINWDIDVFVKLHTRLIDNSTRALDLSSHVLQGIADRQGRDAPFTTLNATESDIVRAAVVFLHAGLDDFLRGVQRAFLPRASRDDLREIPLGGNPRQMKFSLGDLLAYRGQTVDQVIDGSIAAHFERSSFNNVGDVSSLLERLHADASKIDDLKPSIQELMVRRHRIVHQADHAAALDSLLEPWGPRETRDALGWSYAVAVLGSRFGQLLSPDDVQRKVFAEVEADLTKRSEAIRETLGEET
jgi:hypothetical protein